MTITTIMSLIVAGIVGISPAFASDDHKGMDTHHKTMNGDMSHEMGKGHMNGTFLVKKEIDSYQVSFHVMKAPDGMQHGGSHHFMFKAEQDGKALTGLRVNSKVSHPNGTSESKMMMRMGDWYMAAYDLGHAGKHQIMVLFKTSDGKKHFGGIDYPAQRAEE